jgi:hypothetical protein
LNSGLKQVLFNVRNQSNRTITHPAPRQMTHNTGE